MCFNMRCKYQHHFTGECRGAIDWSKPDAACKEEYLCQSCEEIKDGPLPEDRVCDGCRAEKEEW
jgi:hypothetical protein